MTAHPRLDALAAIRDARAALDRAEAALRREAPAATPELLAAVADATGGRWATAGELLRHADALADAAALRDRPPPALAAELAPFRGRAPALGAALRAASLDPPEGFAVERGAREAGGWTWRVARDG